MRSYLLSLTVILTAACSQSDSNVKELAPDHDTAPTIRNVDSNLVKGRFNFTIGKLTREALQNYLNLIADPQEGALPKYTFENGTMGIDNVLYQRSENAIKIKYADDRSDQPPVYITEDSVKVEDKVTPIPRSHQKIWAAIYEGLNSDLGGAQPGQLWVAQEGRDYKLDQVTFDHGRAKAIEFIGYITFDEERMITLFYVEESQD